MSDSVQDSKYSVYAVSSGRPLRSCVPRIKAVETIKRKSEEWRGEDPDLEIEEEVVHVEVAIVVVPPPDEITLRISIDPPKE